MHSSNCFSIETLQEAQIITAEIWQSASCAEIMLTMLSESQLFHDSDYTAQLCLFATSCARRVNHLLEDPRSHQAIRTAELFATKATTETLLHDSHRAAEAATLDLANKYDCSPYLSTDQNVDQSATRRSFFTGALLHAAAAASMACIPSQISSPLKAAESSARYTINALYYEQLSNDTDSTLISQLLNEEQHRQSQALRIFLGNPFDSKRFPPVTIPESCPQLKQASRYQVTHLIEIK
jgi:hypothetical protein